MTSPTADITQNIQGSDGNTARLILSNLSTKRWKSARQLSTLIYPNEEGSSIRKVLEDRIERVISKHLIETGTIEWTTVTMSNGNCFRAYRRVKE